MRRCRWDGCFIRLLDGMLQAGALGSSDYQLRIPTKIRHLEILDANPPLPAGSQGESSFLNVAEGDAAAHSAALTLWMVLGGRVMLANEQQAAFWGLRLRGGAADCALGSCGKFTVEALVFVANLAIAGQLVPE